MFHSLGEGRGILLKLDEGSMQSLVKHALTNTNTNQLTDEDLRQIIAHQNLGGPVPAVGDLSTEMMIETLANHYGCNKDDCLLNFQSTDPGEGTNCLMKDPFAETAWLS